ncbi:hypothetical protein NC981_09205 [Leptolyngbya sp. DQ-M1]|uniref:hypothetical protein n=1 Tax=Leptolyngbya sp. DQ-M1 TaxID=2933920 RepID=UPI003299764D
MNKFQWRSQWHIRRDRIPQMILVIAIGIIPLSYAIASGISKLRRSRSQCLISCRPPCCSFVVSQANR